MTLRKKYLNLSVPTVFKCNPPSFLAKNSNLTLPLCINCLYVHINLKFMSSLILSFKYLLTSLNLFLQGQIAEIMICIFGFTLLIMPIKFPKSEIIF